jgi:hypothetical protein
MTWDGVVTNFHRKHRNDLWITITIEAISFEKRRIQQGRQDLQGSRETEDSNDGDRRGVGERETPTFIKVNIYKP